MNVTAGAIYEATVDFGTAGLVGLMGLTVLDNEGNVSVGRFSDNIIEIGPGMYSRVGNIAPSSPGQYSLRWDDGSLGVGHTALEDLNVSASVPGPFPVVVTASTDLCEMWASVDEMLDCCADLASTDTSNLEWSLQQASELLYKLSGHQYPGTCEAAVRPCSGYTSCWPRRVGYGSEVAGEAHAGNCCCPPLSKIRLAGYPVQQIIQVLIDGAVVDASGYRVDHGRELVRMADAEGKRQSWPACQRMDLASGVGTFFVSYAYGENPPIAGVRAAAQLACELAKQCPGASGDAADCALPTGTVRIARQGITIDTQALGIWLLGTQQTGMGFVDSFLSVYGMARRRRTALLVPEADPWPLRTG